MRNNFQTALDAVLKFEGGYSNHPADPGGPTNLGITQAVLSAWIGRKASVNEVKLLSRDTAAAIYKARYWTPCRCDELPSGVDYVLFDFGVNAGIGQAVKTLQRVLGVARDGIFGPVTMGALQRRQPAELVTAFDAAKVAFYRGLTVNKPSLKVFLNGWLNRCRAAKLQALELVTAKGKATVMSLQDFQPVLGNTAPTAANLLTGPLGGFALRALGELIDAPDHGEESIAQTLAGFKITDLVGTLARWEQAVQPLVVTATPTAKAPEEPGEVPAPTAAEPTVIDLLLGSKLTGWKTYLAIILAVLVNAAAALGVAPAILTPENVVAINTALAGLGTAGLISKVERYTKLIAGLLATKKA